LFPAVVAYVYRSNQLKAKGKIRAIEGKP